MSARTFIPAPDVARILGLPDAMAFLRRRARLESETYFPAPMPHSTRPLLWKACEVAAWVDRHGNAPDAQDAALDPAVLAAAVQSGKLHLLHLARSV